MAYQSLYRKYRPKTFDEVKGQDSIVTALRNQIKHDKIGHAYLFCGTRGTGKTSVAKIFARAVNCEQTDNGNPCNHCETCASINNNTSLNVIEIDAASNNGVDNIRQLKEDVAYKPQQGRYKVYIIDEVHMLSTGAFNALLKTLEEPPAHAIFVLATTEAHKIPVTITSRCQRYDFKRVPLEIISDRLSEIADKENIKIEPDAIKYMAKAGDGSMRDALSVMEQCVSSNMGEKITYNAVINTIGAVNIDMYVDLYEKINNRDIVGTFDLVKDISEQGKDLTRFVNDYTYFLRNIMITKASGSQDMMLDMTKEDQERIRSIAERADLKNVVQYINQFSDLAAGIKNASQKRIYLETALVKVCREGHDEDIFKAKIDKLEAEIAELRSNMEKAKTSPVYENTKKKSNWRTNKGRTRK